MVCLAIDGVYLCYVLLNCPSRNIQLIPTCNPFEAWWIFPKIFITLTHNLSISARYWVRLCLQNPTYTLTNVLVVITETAYITLCFACIIFSASDSTDPQKHHIAFLYLSQQLCNVIAVCRHLCCRHWWNVYFTETSLLWMNIKWSVLYLYHADWISQLKSPNTCFYVLGNSNVRSFYH